MARKRRASISKASPETAAPAELGGAWSPDVGFLEEIGSTGLQRSGGVISEEWHRQLNGSRAYKTFREMYDSDAAVGAICYAFEILALGAKWYVEPSDPNNPEAVAWADFVQGCWDDMEHTPAEFTQQALSFVPFGWSFFEVVYKRRLGQSENKSTRSRYTDGKIGWRKIALRAQDSLEKWEYDEDGDLIGMWQAPPEGGRYLIPLRKAVHFRVRGNKGSPEGRSMLRNAFRSWWLKKRLEEVEGVGYERNLAGLPKASVPPEMLRDDADAATKAILATIKTIVQSVRTDERMGVVFPAEEYTDANGNTRKTGFKFELVSSAGRNGAEIGAAIQRYRADIAITLLAEHILLGMDGVGSYALSSDKTANFARAVGAVLDMMGEEMDRQLLPPLMRLNGVPEELWPRMAHGDVESRALGEFATAMSALVGAGLVTPDAALEERIREENGLPEMAPDLVPGAADDMVLPGPELEEKDDDPGLASAVALAQQMTEHQIPRCEHGSVNRCRKCGIEKDRGVQMGEDGKPVTGPDGKHVWRLQWRAIGAKKPEPEIDDVAA